MMRSPYLAMWVVVTTITCSSAALSAGPAGCDGVANRSPLRDADDRPRNSVNLSPEQRASHCGQADGRMAGRVDDGSQALPSAQADLPAVGTITGSTNAVHPRVRTRRPDREEQRVRDRLADPSADGWHRSRPRGEDRHRHRRDDDVGTPAGQLGAQAGGVGGQAAGDAVPLFPPPAKPARPARPGG